MTFCTGAAGHLAGDIHVELIGEEARHAAAIDEVDATLAGGTDGQVARPVIRLGESRAGDENSG